MSTFVAQMFVARGAVNRTRSSRISASYLSAMPQGSTNSWKAFRDWSNEREINDFEYYIRKMGKVTEST